MEDVEKQFNEITTQSPEDILAEIRQLKDALGPVLAILKEAQETKESCNAEIKAQEAVLHKLREERNTIDHVVWDTQRKMRDLERKVQSAERRFQEAEAARVMRAEYEKLYDEFDKLTAGAPWREFAYDHQITGAKKLAAQKRAILGDKRGLGKTLTSLVWLDMVQAKKVIAVVPNDTQGNFMQEVSSWAPHRVPSMIRIGGMTKEQRDALLNIVLPNMDSYFIIINYEAWRRDPELIESLVNLQPDAIIMDEAHAAKNRKTKVYKGLRRLITAPNKCSHCGSGNIGMTEDHYGSVRSVHCRECGKQPEELFDFNSLKNVLPMTGTPILNRPQDLFSLLSIIDPVTFNSENNFLYDYCQQDLYTSKWRFRPGGLERLTKQLASRFVMRDRHTAGIKIPPQRVQYYDVVLDPALYPKQARMMQALNEHAMIVLENNEGLPVLYLIALITRKRQAAVWGQGIEFKDREGTVLFKADCDESVKLDKVITVDGTGNGPEGLVPELIGEYDPELKRWVDGERVVIFSQFQAPLDELSKRLTAANVSNVVLDGRTPEYKRREIQLDLDRRTASETDYKYQVVLANYKVGGVGLNFTAATQMIIIDEEWNPGKVDQAYGRIDRMGQTEETTVHVIRLANSIDSWMAALIEDKAAMIDGFEESIDLQQRLIDGISGGML